MNIHRLLFWWLYKMKFLGGNAARPFEQVSKYKFVYNFVTSKKKRISQHGVSTMKILKLSTERKSNEGEEVKSLSAEKKVEK